MTYEALNCVTAQPTTHPTFTCLTHTHLYYCLSVYLCTFTETNPQCDLFRSFLCNIYSEDILCGCGMADWCIRHGKTERLPAVKLHIRNA